MVACAHKPRYFAHLLLRQLFMSSNYQVFMAGILSFYQCKSSKSTTKSNQNQLTLCCQYKRGHQLLRCIREGLYTSDDKLHFTYNKVGKLLKTAFSFRIETRRPLWHHLVSFFGNRSSFQGFERTTQPAGCLKTTKRRRMEPIRIVPGVSVILRRIVLLQRL